MRIRDKIKSIYGFAAYILLSIVPLVTLLTAHLFYNQLSYNQTAVINRYAQKQIETNISDTFTQIRNIYTSITSKEDLRTVFFLSKQLEYFTSEKISGIKDQLISATQLSEAIDLIYIYIERDDVVLSSQGVLNSRIFFDVNFKNSQLTYDQWIKTFKEGSATENYSIFENGGKDNILYSISISNAVRVYEKDTAVMLGAVIAKDKFFGNFTDVDWLKQSNTYLFDTNNRLILNNIMVSNPDQKEIESIADIMELKNKNSVLESYISFDATSNYKLYIVIPKNAGVRLPRIVEGISLGVLLLNIVFSVWLLVRLAKKNYRPILNSLTLLGKDNRRIEYAIIEDSIKNLLINNHALNEKIDLQKQNFKDMLLNKLLNSEISDDLEFLLLDCGITFKFNYFFVMSFSIGKFSDNDGNMQEQSLYPIIKKTFEDAFTDDESIAYVFESEGKYACIINTSHNHQDYLHSVAQVAAYSLNLLSSETYFSILLGISNIHESYAGISSAYFEAVTALTRSEKTYKSKIFLYEDHKHTPKEYLSLSKENKIIQYIKEGDTQNVVRELEEVFAHLGDVSLKITEYVLYDIICMLLKAPNIIHLDEEDALAQKLNIGYFLPYIQDIGKFKERVLEMVVWLCDDVQSKRSDSNKEIVDVAVHYIHKNYADCNLSVGSVSDYIHFSTVHVTNLFKKYYYTTPNEYIHQYRISVAKELIENNVPINEVIGKVGYSNSRSFNRIFKKYTNMTPVEYRKTVLTSDGE